MIFSRRIQQHGIYMFTLRGAANCKCKCQSIQERRTGFKTMHLSHRVESVNTCLGSTGCTSRCTRFERLNVPGGFTLAKGKLVGLQAHYFRIKRYCSLRNPVLPAVHNHFTSPGSCKPDIPRAVKARDVPDVERGSNSAAGNTGRIWSRGE